MQSNTSDILNFVVNIIDMIGKIKLFSSFPGNFQEEILQGLKDGFLKPLKVWYQQQKKDALVVPYQADEVLVVFDQYPEIYDDIDYMTPEELKDFFEPIE
jgi:hypothetical protein